MMKAACNQFAAEGQACSGWDAAQNAIQKLRRENDELRGIVAKMLRVAESSVDTRRCPSWVLRAMNAARAAAVTVPTP